MIKEQILNPEDEFRIWQLHRIYIRILKYKHKILSVRKIKTTQSVRFKDGPEFNIRGKDELR